MKIKFDEVPYYKVAERTDQVKPFSGKKGIIDSCKKVIEIITPFLIPEKVAQFNKDNKKPKHLADLPLLVNELMRSSKDPIQNWYFNEDPDELIITITFMHGVYTQDNYLMPLYWLPKMAKRNKRLHDIIVHTLKYARYKTDVAVFDDDEGGWPYENVSEGKIYIEGDKLSISQEDELTIKRKDEQLNLFDAHFQKYLKLIHEFPIKPGLIKSRIKNFPVLINFEQYILDWCLDIVECAEQCQVTFWDLHEKGYDTFLEMSETTREEAEYGCPPVSMRSWVQFCWFDDPDHSENVQQYIESSAGECGLIESYMNYECRNSQDVQIGIDKFYSEFGKTPDKIAGIINAGKSMLDMIEFYIKGNLLSSLSDEKYKRQPIYTT